MKNGKYIVKRHLNGKDSILGRFEIKDNSIVFANEADRLNIDQFPSGPITQYVKDRIDYLMTNADKDIYIEKV